jgi:hypothetical protein
VPIARDSQESDAAAARKALQKVLDEHKALPGRKIDKQNKRARKQRARRRAAEDAA